MNNKWKAKELLIANKELAFQIAEKEKLAAVLAIFKKKLTTQDVEKTKLTEELIIADEDKANRAAELVVADEEKTKLAEELIVADEEKAKRAAELVVADEEKTKLAEELIVADEEKAKRAAELVIADLEKSVLVEELIIADQEKAKRAAELIIANVEKAKRANELVAANEEKTKLASELIIAKSEKAKRAAELVIAQSEKAKRAAELVIANFEKEKRAGELIIADKELNYQNKEKAKRAAELVIANINKTKRNAELVIANVEKAKRAAAFVIANKELSYQTVEKAKRAAEFVIADAEKAKREAELVIANIKKAKRAAEFVIANVEKAKRAAELVIANKELVYQKSEKANRAAELIIANVEKAKRAAELVIANVEKVKHAAEFVIADNELVLKKEKERLVIELISTNKELTFQIKEKEKREKELIVLNELLDNQNKEKEKQTIELIHAKEKAEESERLKSAFLTNMSHEIRTPMNGIIGFTQLLKEPNLTNEEQQEFIGIIEESGARMLNTMNNIVDISKIESGLMTVDIKETNINEQVEFLYAFFKPEVESKGMQLFFKNSLSLKEAVIKIDIEKIYGILTNLVKNAIKFTTEGSIEFGYEKKGKYLEFFVKDTGIGISQKQQEIIFERFRQGSESYDRNYEGSGLGLSIAKSYVEMIGGKIWVESELREGSIFYFTVPYNAVSNEKNTIKDDVSPEDREVRIKKLKILIAEDDETSYSFFTRVLQEISYEVLHAITGVEAVVTCFNNPDLDLVLMDIKMTDMDGYEATRQIRQFNKDVIIIAQTAYALSGDREKAIEAGCNDYITKPVKKSLLKALIKKHFNNKNKSTDDK
jgi:signal transduction histidine kinase/CheY-like chemotaxis protein